MTDEPEERHHTDAEYNELKADRDELQEFFEVGADTIQDLESTIKELKAKLEEQERLCAEKHLKDRDTIQELKAKLDEIRVFWRMRVSQSEWRLHDNDRLRAELAQLKKDREKK